MDDKTLQELKGSLLAEQKRLKEELNRFAAPTDNPEDYKTRFVDIGPDRDENASEVEEYTDNLGLESNLEKQLHEVDDALTRIEQGTFGKCANCDEDIDVERLRAYPSAKTCVKCTK